jgi:hypothetical protein
MKPKCSGLTTSRVRSQSSRKQLTKNPHNALTATARVLSEIGVFDSCRACLPHVKESLPDIGRRHLRESSGLEGL